MIHSSLYTKPITYSINFYITFVKCFLFQKGFLIFSLLIHTDIFSLKTDPLLSVYLKYTSV